MHAHVKMVLQPGQQTGVASQAYKTKVVNLRALAQLAHSMMGMELKSILMHVHGRMVL